MSLRSLFVVFVILIPGFIWALFSRFAALLLYLWYAFFRPQDWIYWDIASLRLSLVIGLLLLISCLLTGVVPNLTHPLSLGALAFLGAILVAQTQAINQTIGWQWIDFFGRLLLVSLLAVSLMRTPRQWIRVLSVVAGSLGFYGAKAGFVSMVGGGVQYSDGLAGAFIDNNGYALAIVMVIPLLIVLAQNAELAFDDLVPAWTVRWIRIGLFASVPLCAYCVVSTFSRGGFLAMAAALVAFLLFHPHRVRILVALTVLAVVAYITVPLPAGYVERVQSITDTRGHRPEDDPGEGRLYFWSMAMRMASDHPFGVGIKNFESNYDSYDTLRGAYGQHRAVHSSHFEVLAEVGYDGTVIWIGLFVYAFVLLFRIRRRGGTPGLDPRVARLFQTASVGLIVSQVGFLVGGAFVADALNDLSWVTFALIASLDIISAQLTKAAAPVAGRVELAIAR
jgi:putative inorganic carbon (HCO3(-)) transporter